MALTTDQAQKALIAFNRFGLGAKPGGPEELGANPRNRLISEVNRPGIAEINDASLPTYAVACRASQIGFDEAETIRSRELSARINKQMQAQIGFVERLVIFWANHFSMTVNKIETVRGTSASGSATSSARTCSANFRHAARDDATTRR